MVLGHSLSFILEIADRNQPVPFDTFLEGFEFLMDV